MARRQRVSFLARTLSRRRVSFNSSGRRVSFNTRRPTKRRVTFYARR